MWGRVKAAWRFRRRVYYVLAVGAALLPVTTNAIDAFAACCFTIVIFEACYATHRRLAGCGT